MFPLTLPLLPLLHLTLVLSAPAPFPQNTVSIGPLGIATVSTGISITMYTKPSCEKSSAVQTVELQYNHPIAQQFHSYKLNGTFTDQTVSIYAPVNWKAEGSNAVDGLAVGNVAVGVSLCLASVLLFYFFFSCWVGC